MSVLLQIYKTACVFQKQNIRCVSQFCAEVEKITQNNSVAVRTLEKDYELLQKYSNFYLQKIPPFQKHRHLPDEWAHIRGKYTHQFHALLTLAEGCLKNILQKP